MVKPIPFSYDEISRVLRYDPETGEIKWRVTLTSRAKADQKAGVWLTSQINGKRYLSLTYKGRKIVGTHLAWFLQTGEWPDRAIFFRDGDPENMKFENFRIADHKAIRITRDDGSVGYKMTSAQSRHYGLRRYYGISVAEYTEMHARQGGVCAICKNPESAGHPGRRTVTSGTRIRDISVDHDHETGKVRELLCNACNHILGEAKESVEILLAAADYLIRHKQAQEV